MSPPFRLRAKVPYEETDYVALKNALSQYSNIRAKITSLLKSGELIRVKKGLYVFGPTEAKEPYSKEILANLIYGPSYISLDYALSLYGIVFPLKKTRILKRLLAVSLTVI
jgi:predicted transcriptional regulator of viral defense system